MQRYARRRRYARGGGAPLANLPFDWLIRSLGRPFPFLTPGPLDAIAKCRDLCVRPIRDLAD